MDIVFIVIGSILLITAVLLWIAFYKWIRPEWCAQKFMREKYETTKNVKERAKIVRDVRQVFVGLTVSVMLIFGLFLIIIGILMIF